MAALGLMKFTNTILLWNGVEPAMSSQSHYEFEKALRKLLAALQDLNSIFPETRRFLEARRLDHISQLDEKGLRELEKHLREIRSRLVH